MGFYAADMASQKPFLVAPPDSGVAQEAIEVVSGELQRLAAIKLVAISGVLIH